MKTMRMLLLFIGLAAAANDAAAECYADFKAKQDRPLRLQYGVIALEDADCSGIRAAARAIEARIARDGWTLLNVLSIFDATGLAERKGNAGAFFLRY